ncbi:hypothetical protein [uncultured Cellulomonas sp.]|uniref:restriction system modified-DNA reader domain-containing protein n=1 Tax=uncultured Cellulomonas sp. TaxID=189682 RepID=UPI0026206FF3|nr:hypothetical protein [uncultured Cellulomonas sp.]
MPIFELDTGRPTVLQPMRPAAGTFDNDSAALVAEHLVGLLGEPLFPVAVREPGADSPHLLAVDAAGQPVVVEVVQVLDTATLTRSLRYAGTAARMSSVDLARAYRSGPEDFATDLVAFREGVPVARAHAAARHGGARLFVLCSEVAENVVDAVEFLRGPGRQIEVLQLGVVRGADGRRYAEVSPLVADVPRRRPVEPSTLRVLPHTGALPVVTPRADDGRRLAADADDVDLDDVDVDGTGQPGAGTDRERVVGALAPTGTFPSVLPVPVGPVGAEPADVQPVDAQPVDAQPDDDATTDAIDAADDEPVDATSVPEPVVHPDAAPADETDAAPTEPEPEPTEPEYTESGLTEPEPTEPLPALTSLAGVLGGTTTLVWRRLRRGQRFVLALLPDGRLQLPDGTVFTDPDVAATTVAGAESPLDGWRAWHIGDGGPALADAVDHAAPTDPPTDPAAAG